MIQDINCVYKNCRQETWYIIIIIIQSVVCLNDSFEMIELLSL